MTCGRLIMCLRAEKNGFFGQFDLMHTGLLFWAPTSYSSKSCVCDIKPDNVTPVH